MPRFAANLSMMYAEHAFPDRFAAAARDGFEAVEFMFPYDWRKDDLAARLRDAGVLNVLMNAPPGDWLAGERGLAALPDRQDDFRRSIDAALVYADAFACPRIHVMAGVAPEGVDRALCLDTYRQNLAWAADQARSAGRTLLIEPINTRDMPGYLLNRQADAHAIVSAIDSPHLQVQMDLYHCQIMEGDLTTRLRALLPTGRVGHLQIAGVPDRHEPDQGEVNYAQLFDVIDTVSAQCGWDGWIGAEYRPRYGAEAGGTTRGLGWVRPWLKRGS